MNRFYVLEGHKRVSVLKYFDAVSIPAVVTRILPTPNDSVESKIYYEFLEFYHYTGINYLLQYLLSARSVCFAEGRDTRRYPDR